MTILVGHIYNSFSKTSQNSNFVFINVPLSPNRLELFNENLNNCLQLYMSKNVN